MTSAKVKGQVSNAVVGGRRKHSARKRIMNQQVHATTSPTFIVNQLYQLSSALCGIGSYSLVTIGATLEPKPQNKLYGMRSHICTFGTYSTRLYLRAAWPTIAMASSAVQQRHSPPLNLPFNIPHSHPNAPQPLFAGRKVPLVDNGAPILYPRYARVEDIVEAATGAEDGGRPAKKAKTDGAGPTTQADGTIVINGVVYAPVAAAGGAVASPAPAKVGGGYVLAVNYCIRALY